MAFSHNIDCLPSKQRWTGPSGCAYSYRMLFLQVTISSRYQKQKNMHLPVFHWEQKVVKTLWVIFLDLNVVVFYSFFSILLKFSITNSHHISIASDCRFLSSDYRYNNNVQALRNLFKSQTVGL